MNGIRHTSNRAASGSTNLFLNRAVPRPASSNVRLSASVCHLLLWAMQLRGALVLLTLPLAADPGQLLSLSGALTGRRSAATILLFRRMSLESPRLCGRL